VTLEYMTLEAAFQLEILAQPVGICTGKADGHRHFMSS
jgi:hypothetical protein